MWMTLLRKTHWTKNSLRRILWPTLFANAKAHTKKSNICQKYAQNDLHMDLPLHPTLSIVPLEKRGIDYIGPIALMSSKRNQYIIIVMEYLIKWVEAKAIKELTKLFQINHQKTIAYYPQTNGLIERVNKMLFQILRKTIVDSKQD